MVTKKKTRYKKYLVFFVLKNQIKKLIYITTYMKILKTFETWNNNEIDKSLFKSGRAKYDPTVVGNKIKYNTGDSTPYYYAEITKKGNKFICKIYRIDKKGKKKRLRNKIKTDLKLAHNYVREFLNQRLKKDEKKNKTNTKKNRNKEKRNTDIDSMILSPEEMSRPPMDNIGMFSSPKPKNKTFIRRF